MNYKREFLVALKVSTPVFMGYSVLGFAFGLLLVTSGYSWYLAPIMSIFIYAGALQFLAIGFFNAKLGLLDIAIASWFLNIRQSFYGLSLLEKFKNTKWLKPYLIFGITDEYYGLLTSVKDDESLSKKHYYFFLSLLNQSYWILGSTAGAIFGMGIEFSTAGIEFSLTALFIVLALEQYKNISKISPFIIGSVSSIVALLYDKKNMLLFAILISIVLLFTFKNEIKDE